MSEETLRKQRPVAEIESPLSPVERFALLRAPQAVLEARACAMLNVPETPAGESVVDALAAEFGVELNAAEMLLAVHMCDGQHAGRLVFAAPAAAAAGRAHSHGAGPPRGRASGPLPPPAAQRRGSGVGGGVCL